jgi:hypothetical protein
MKTEIQTEPVLARRIRATEDSLVITLVNSTVSIPWKECSMRLARATSAQRVLAELSPSGYGIHWPLLDEDLAIGPLVENRRQ